MLLENVSFPKCHYEKKIIFIFKKMKAPQKKKKCPAELNAVLKSKVNLPQIKQIYSMINVANMKDPRG